MDYYEYEMHKETSKRLADERKAMSERMKKELDAITENFWDGDWHKLLEEAEKIKKQSWDYKIKYVMANRYVCGNCKYFGQHSSYGYYCGKYDKALVSIDDKNVDLSGTNFSVSGFKKVSPYKLNYIKLPECDYEGSNDYVLQNK